MSQKTMFELPYAHYLGLEQLFALQGDLATLHHADELLFRTVHLASELWLRQAAIELERATAALEADHLLVAYRLLERANRALVALVDQLGMLETMAVQDYHQFREALGSASGLQSPGYALIKQAARSLIQAFETALHSTQTDLAAIYADHQQAELSALHAIAEALYAIDTTLNRFLYGHLLNARRFLGDTGTGTGGKAVEYLRKALEDVLFPQLWAVRGEIADRFRSSYGVGPTEE